MFNNKQNFSLPPLCTFIDMDNRGEVSQILNGITFGRNMFFNAGKSY